MHLCRVSLVTLLLATTGCYAGNNVAVAPDESQAELVINEVTVASPIAKDVVVNGQEKDSDEMEGSADDVTELTPREKKDGNGMEIDGGSSKTTSHLENITPITTMGSAQANETTIAATAESKAPQGTKIGRGKGSKPRRPVKSRRKAPKGTKPTPVDQTTKAVKQPRLTKEPPTTTTTKSVTEDAQRLFEGTCSVSCGKFKDFRETIDIRINSLSVRLTQMAEQTRVLKEKFEEIRLENQQMKDERGLLVKKLDEMHRRIFDLEAKRVVETVREWASWSSWSSCSVTCEAGIKWRNRTCKGDQSWNDHCKGKAKEVQKCQIKSKCENITLSCDVSYKGHCFSLHKTKRKVAKNIHSTYCKNGKGGLANIYSSNHLKLIKEFAAAKMVAGQYIWTGMSYDSSNEKVSKSDGTKAEFVKWMHEFGASKKQALVGMVLHFDPHEKFRKENNFHVLNGLKNVETSTPLQYSLCEFKPRKMATKMTTSMATKTTTSMTTQTTTSMTTQTMTSMATKTNPMTKGQTATTTATDKMGLDE